MAVALIEARLASGKGPKDEILLLVASLGRQKRFDEALRVLDRVWEGCPVEVAGGTSIALLRAAHADVATCKKVEKNLRAALAMTKSANLHVQLGAVLDLENDSARAEEEYRAALKIEPDNVLALNNLAWLLALREHKGDEALKLINQALARVGPRGELLDTRAVVYLSQGRPREALADLSDAIKEEETPARCFHLARAYHLAKQRQQAVKLLRRADELGLHPSELHPAEQKARTRLYAELTRR